MKNRKTSAWHHVDGGSAFIIPVSLLRHPKWSSLSAHANKLVLDLGRQYSGRNNGYLLACWERMREWGWKSRETLALAVAECEHHALIVRTRQGGRNRPNRYALTWWPIHEFDGDPLDTPKTFSPSNAWKAETGPFEIPASIRERRRRALPMVNIIRSPPSVLADVRKAA
jgi:hypothetical protein